MSIPAIITGSMSTPKWPTPRRRWPPGALCCLLYTSSLHFAPTAEARANLLRENVAAETIFTTGNTVIDALLATVRPDYAFHDAAIDALLAQPGKRVLITAHRRENQGQPMVHIFNAVKDLHESLTDCQFIFPIHKNPRVRALAAEILGDLERVRMIEPLDYAPFANLMARVDLIMTDSGGLQEEAPALGKPVLVLRENTERPEAVAAGTVLLVGSDRERIFAAAHTLLTDQAAYERMQRAINPYGDGGACERIIKAIAYFLHLSEERPADWQYQA